jgi:urease gamma subunit
MPGNDRGVKMHLTQKETERLLLFQIAEIARRRWCRNLELNYIEAGAIICDELIERARSGSCTVTDLVGLGQKIISGEDVMEGTESLLPVLQLEVLFPDGNKLITVHSPIFYEKRSDTVKELISFPPYMEVPK